MQLDQLHHDMRHTALTSSRDTRDQLSAVTVTTKSAPPVACVLVDERLTYGPAVCGSQPTQHRLALARRVRATSMSMLTSGTSGEARSAPEPASRSPKEGTAVVQTALVLVHDDDLVRGEAMLGMLHEALILRGYRAVVRSVLAGQTLPSHRDVDVIIALGSEASAYDTGLPWLNTEVDFLRDAIADETPILGICFGAQLLARALGGAVEPSDTPELGLIEVETDVPAILSRGPWVSSHYDVIRPPSGALVIARTSVAVQAFVHGPHLGLQMHPEVDTAVLRAWQGRRKANLPPGDVQLGTWLDVHAVSAVIEAEAGQRLLLLCGILESFKNGAFANLWALDG